MLHIWQASELDKHRQVDGVETDGGFKTSCVNFHAIRLDNAPLGSLT